MVKDLDLVWVVYKIAVLVVHNIRRLHPLVIEVNHIEVPLTGSPPMPTHVVWPMFFEVS